jgi:CxxC motif-containing protein
MVSVKTENPIPKENMMDVMAHLRSITVAAPIAIGTVVVSDIFGTKILATQKVD